MRYVLIGLALAVGACAPQQQPPGAAALATAYELYQQCLAAMPPDKCETPRARFEAARAYADAAPRREVIRPPIVFQPYIPPPVQPPRQPITCTTYGNTTSCY